MKLRAVLFQSLLGRLLQEYSVLSCDPQGGHLSHNNQVHPISKVTAYCRHCAFSFSLYQIPVFAMDHEEIDDELADFLYIFVVSKLASHFVRAIESSLQRELDDIPVPRTPARQPQVPVTYNDTDSWESEPPVSKLVKQVFNKPSHHPTRPKLVETSPPTSAAPPAQPSPAVADLKRREDALAAATADLKKREESIQRREETILRRQQDFEAKMAAQQAEFEQIKNEELKKIRSERKALTQHAKVNGDREKKDRAEIESLREQLAKLQSDLKVLHY